MLNNDLLSSSCLVVLARLVGSCGPPNSTDIERSVSQLVGEMVLELDESYVNSGQHPSEDDSCIGFFDE